MRDSEDDQAKRDQPERDQPERGPDPARIAAPRIDRAFARLRSSASAKSRRDKHRVAAALFGEPPEPEPEPTTGEG